MGIGGGSKFTLEKTWRSTGTGTETFNTSGNTTVPFGKQAIYVTARGGSSTANYNPPSPGNAATYNSPTGGNVAYNPVSSGNIVYNPYYPGEAYYNPYYPGNAATYNSGSPGNAIYNPGSPGTAIYNSPTPALNIGWYVQQFVYDFSDAYADGYYQDYSVIQSFTCPSPEYYVVEYYGPGGVTVAVVYESYSCSPAGYTDPGFPTDSYNPPTGGNIAGYNPPSGQNVATYNSPSGGNFAGYNNPSGGNFAGYNPPSGGNFAGYNPPTGGNVATYNSPTGGNIANYNTGASSTALGVTAPGGVGGAAGSVVGPVLVNNYSYPDNATYPVTVAPGGYVTVTKT